MIVHVKDDETTTTIADQLVTMAMMIRAGGSKFGRVEYAVNPDASGTAHVMAVYHDERVPETVPIGGDAAPLVRMLAVLDDIAQERQVIAEPVDRTRRRRRGIIEQFNETMAQEDRQGLRLELIRLAAMAVAWVESIDTHATNQEGHRVT